jgi:plasmid replication initiation protein
MTALEKMRLDKEPKKNLNLIKVQNTFIDGFIADNNTETLKILFYIARSGITKSEGRLKIVTIDTKAMCEYCHISIKTLKHNLKKMQKTSITLVDDSDEFRSVSLLPDLRIIMGRNKLEVSIFNIVLDLIVEVERKYTTIDLSNLMKLKNKHSLKMIQILENINGFDIDIPKRKRYSLEELQALFGVKYKTCYAFEVAVLKPCKAELDDKSNLSFLYDTKFIEVPRGRPKATGFIIDLIDNKRRQPTLFN